MPVSPRVAIGAPLFEKAEYLPAAVDSLLGQSFEDFVLVLVDDGSTDETAAIAGRYAAHDPRVLVRVNARRLGMLGNTREALRRARMAAPAADFVLLASDHDVWDPEFLTVLVGLLDGQPDAILAAPGVQRIDEHGVPYAAKRKSKGKNVTTLGIKDDLLRARTAFGTMAAGDMVYGLMRADAIETVGHYRDVLVPDRLLLFELALRGPTTQSFEVLLQRRFRGLASLERQRRGFWPDGLPWHARLPWWLQHTGALFVAYGVQAGHGEAAVGRTRGLRIALDYLRMAVWQVARRRAQRARRRGEGLLRFVPGATPKKVKGRRRKATSR